MTKTLILNSSQIDQKINRLAYELYENNYSEKELIMAGITGNGYELAVRLTKMLENISDISVRLIKISIDKKNPSSQEVEMILGEKELKNKVVVLVDDVLNSGKTLIFGAKPFLTASLKRLTTVVLVDRGHNRYPIKADFVGLPLSTTLQEHITVDLSVKGAESAFLS